VSIPVRRQVKDNNGEKGDGDARYDKVDGVEECLSADRYVERDIRLRLRAAVVALDMLAGRNVQDVPLYAPVEVLQVNAVMNRILLTRLLVNVGQVDL